MYSVFCLKQNRIPAKNPNPDDKGREKNGGKMENGGKIESGLSPANQPAQHISHRWQVCDTKQHCRGENYLKGLSHDTG